ncbi:MAG: hypothetical protein Q8K63_02625, partial [Acidimicrobiales bacterium]|nr:hypothetical protein [Acidimicrobiales bacterium]
MATLAGRLLADYPLRDWSKEPQLPFGVVGPEDESEDEDESSELDGTLFATGTGEPRLLHDVRIVLSEVGRRVTEAVKRFYPGNPERGGALPWAYLWAVTIPCDGCRRRFPLIGSMVLRHPYNKTGDKGQALRLMTTEDDWHTEVISGGHTQTPTFASSDGKRGKSARCPFPTCGTVHSLDAVKAKGFANQYEDALLAVAESEPDSTRKIFRVPTADEVAVAASVDLTQLPRSGMHSAIPDEVIPAGNTNTIQALLCGYSTFGSLMNDRQALLFATTARVIDELAVELKSIVSAGYAEALVAYSAANLPRQLRYSTRGAGLRMKGNPDGTAQNRVMVDDVFSSQSVIKHQFDYLETGLGSGPGTWSSVCVSSLRALRAVLAGSTSDARPARLQRSSAVALPYRDSSVDALVCDPPYYDMITYADSSDLAYAWLKRALSNAIPD